MKKTTKPNDQFLLTLMDRKGNVLNMGDIVKVANQRGEFTFYSEVKFLEAEKKIAPFHTFSFHSFEKVDSVPKHATLSTEDRYKIWYTHNPESESTEIHEIFNKYLTDWRACEHLLEQSCFTLIPS
jgi:hypothetical protein